MVVKTEKQFVKNLIKLLEKYRASEDLHVAQMARRIGITHQAYGQFVKFETTPKSYTLYRIIKFIKIDIKKIFE